LLTYRNDLGAPSLDVGRRSQQVTPVLSTMIPFATNSIRTQLLAQKTYTIAWEPQGFLFLARDTAQAQRENVAMIAHYAKASRAGELQRMRSQAMPHEAMIDVQHRLTRRAGDQPFVSCWHDVGQRVPIHPSAKDFQP
jgi:hypothetical protein